MEIPGNVLPARFIRALPDEYGHVKATLQAIKNGPGSSVWSARGTPPCHKRRDRNGHPGRPNKRSSRAKAAAGVVRDEIVAAVAGAPKTVAAAGAAARVEVAAARAEVAAARVEVAAARAEVATARVEVAAAVVAPAVVVTAAVAALLAAVGDAIGGVTSGTGVYDEGERLYPQVC